jgi:uroporphyrinogen-III synthase
VAVQVDGGGSPALVGPLAAAGFDLRVVRPHRWAPPPDAGPVRRLVLQLVGADLDLVAFTSAPGVDGLFEAAADLGRADALCEALGQATAVAAIGPVTAEALEAKGVRVTVCPAQPTAEALVAAVAAWRMLPVAPTPMALDPAGRAVRRDGRCVPLTDLEFSLLASLSRRPGLVCPTPVLLREVWGHGDRRRLEVLVSRLRSRLTPLDLSITAVPKRGYRLE